MKDRYKLTFSRLKKKLAHARLGRMRFMRHSPRLGFCPFAVLGDPTPKESLQRIKKYLAAKPDFLELGIPFSDPIADGPVIQAADERALKNGMTPKKALELLKKIRSFMLRQAQHDVPIGILTYLNIVLAYGTDTFYRDLKKAGADSILIADVPLEEAKPFAKGAKRHGLHQIFLVSEYTDAARLKKIERLGSGFLYVVSALGVTGVKKDISKNLPPLLKKLSQQTSLPLVVGFGISEPHHLKQLTKTEAVGAIVGSLLVKTPTSQLSGSLKKLRNAL